MVYFLGLMIKNLLRFGTISLLIASCTKTSLSEETSVDDVKLTPETEEVEEQEEPKPVKKMWTCPTCTTNEKHVLEQLQDSAGIHDRNSLATILGNIRQESLFHSNICEGGARVNYERCYSGGYGLIQWTTLGRYNGLGSFARKYGCNPSTLECQTRYMINERQFQNALPFFQRKGLTINDYMRPSYRWLGWGIHGSRTQYSHQYHGKMVYSLV